MALTQKQQTNDIGYPHYVNYPVWYTYSSNISSSYFDFNYKYKIYDEDGFVTDYYATLDENENGSVDFSDITSSLVDGTILNFATTTIIQNIPNYFKEYKVFVSEFYDNTEHNATELNKNLCSALQVDKNNVGVDLFTADLTSKYLTHRQLGVEYTEDFYGRGGIGMLNGDINGIRDNNIDEIEVRLTYEGGTTATYRQASPLSNPTFTADISAIGSQEDLAMYVQTSLKSFEGVNMYRIPGYVSENIPNLDDVISYEIEPLTNGSTSTGDIFKFKVNCGSTKDRYNVLWENEYGTLDYFPFEGQTDLSYGSKKSVYKHTDVNINTSTEKYSIGNSHEKTVITNDVEYNYTLRTGFVKEHEAEYLKSLWASRKIFLNNGDADNIPVTNMSVINKIKNRGGFVQYTIQVTYSKKLNI